jgi:hypothetical protein
MEYPTALAVGVVPMTKTPPTGLCRTYPTNAGPRAPGQTTNHNN